LIGIVCKRRINCKPLDKNKDAEPRTAKEILSHRVTSWDKILRGDFPFGVLQRNDEFSCEMKISKCKFFGLTFFLFSI
jgi:hypothetical protein